MVFLDVVYNHFGPDGNYLHPTRQSFFDPSEHTPWGAAINYKTPARCATSSIHNALYWLEEYRFDGLRFDAVHAIVDGSEAAHPEGDRRPPCGAAFPAERHVHLVLENDKQPGAPARARSRRPASLLRCAVERRHPSRLPSPADRGGGRLLRRLRRSAPMSAWPRR